MFFRLGGFARNWHLFAVTCLLLTGYFGARASADERKEFLFLIYINDLKPFAIGDENGHFSGFLPDLIRDIGAQYGWQVRFEYAGRQRAEQHLYEGKADGFLLAEDWAKEPEKLLFTQHLYYHREYLYSSRPLLPTKRLDYLLSDKVVCIRDQYRYPALEPLFDQGLVLSNPVSSHAQMINMLLEQRCDLAPMSDFRVENALSELPQHVKVYRSAMPLSETGISLAVHPSKADFVEDVNAYLASIDGQQLASRLTDYFHTQHGHTQAIHDALQARILDPAPVYVVTNPEAPFIVLDEQERLTGYAVELVQGVLDQAGITGHMYAAPWARVEKEVSENANVLAFAVARSKEREDQYHWITQVTGNLFGFYGRRGEAKGVDNMDKIATLKGIGALRGDVRLEILEQHQQVNKVAYNTWQQALQSLMKQRIDAVFFSDAGMDFHCKQMQIDCRAFERLFIYQELYSYLVLSRQDTDPALAALLQKAAKDYKNSDAFASLAERWLSEYKAQIDMPMHIADGVLKLWNP